MVKTRTETRLFGVDSIVNNEEQSQTRFYIPYLICNQYYWPAGRQE
jgi:hypothetical protein